MPEPILEVRNLVKRYRRHDAPAVDDVSFPVQRGQIFGLVGESGSGKSTTARCIARLVEPTSGSVCIDGVNVLTLDRRELKSFRRRVQMVFQDPYSSLNPRMTIEELVGEGLLVHGLTTTDRQRRDRVVELLEQVGLDSSHLTRYPRAFSGGQRQRIGIARALAVDPELLVCDEPVSALDVSVQAQVLNLIAELRAQTGLTVVFIAHDLAIVRHLCDSVGVMNAGRLVELGPTESVFTDPQDSYTRDLLEAIPVPDPQASRARRAHRGMEPRVPAGSASAAEGR